MSKSRTELKVGFFVFFCLVLVAVLLVQFSKGSSLFRRAYVINLKASNVGTLRQRASVLMSGVQVGSVSEIHLGAEATNVTIKLKIYNEYTIKDDAEFVIEQNGFLGDQYVAVKPHKNAGKPFRDNPNAIPVISEPFNLQDVARSASGFIKRIDDTARNINDAISDVRREVLNEKTLTNLAATVATLQKVSQDAGTVVDNINGLINSNGVTIGVTVSNLLTFSQSMNSFVQSAQGVVDTNKPQIAIAVSNLQTSTAMLTNLLHEAETGKGLAGALLKDEGLAQDISSLAANLASFSSRLKTNSLWRVLVSKPPEPETAPKSGGNPKK